MGLSPGDTFGRYTIVGTLGIGGMGHVLRAMDNVLERTVALKIIRADKAERKEAIGRFFREARLAAQLMHPNTVQVYDLGEIGDVLFIAMEYIDGQSLSQYCANASIAAPRKLRWLLDAARGLGAAHKCGMIHRDVKPANIMVSVDEVVKVVDFGLAKRSATTLEVKETFHTELGFMVGTPLFMSPEQLEGGKVDALTDQFAWGLTAYTLLCGENPRRSDPLLLDPIPPIHERVPTVSPAAGAIIMRALCTDRAGRHPSMNEIVAALGAALPEPAARLIVTADEPPIRPARLIVSVAPPPLREPKAAALASAPPEPETATEPFRRVVHPLMATAAVGRFGERVGIGLVSPLHGDRARRPKVKPRSEHAPWRFERRADACPVAPLHVAAISRSGKRIVAFGATGMVVHERGAWRVSSVLRVLPPQLVCCTAVLDDGTFIIGRDGARAARFAPNGEVEEWRADPAWSKACFRGVEVTDEGWVTFVGSRGAEGLIAWPGLTELAILGQPLPLAAVVTLSTGLQQLACGPQGALVSTGWRGASRSSGDAELMSLTPTRDGAFVVGSGGRAFHVSGSLEETLDPVDTLSTLTAVTTTEAGTPWAASARGRILRRRVRDGRWVRMSPELDTEPNIIALWASEDRIRAVATDGSLVLGWRRSEARS